MGPAMSDQVGFQKTWLDVVPLLEGTDGDLLLEQRSRSGCRDSMSLLFAIGCVTVARFIYLLYTIPIFFGTVTFIRLFREIDLKKRNVYRVPMSLSMACPLARGER
jgi:hypothetical protein